MRVTVLPRLQVLDPLTDLELPDGATAADAARAAAARLGWRAAERLPRLAGFGAPFDRCLRAGRALEPGAALEEGDVVTYVRVELVAEGWKIEDALGSDDDGDSDDSDA
ncbi:hypothetical protein Rsub_09130 [Raphidocelis subcapitata]|uniref:Ubiquitin-like domain-containing protein n=1 Tax=Raphidocelis subcapitata TaxID=307507 RepID=A0A2V0PH64_9CHLO|nr:hypothetical protein Rsub_09130 [Raphidocelis subcapitata]|eukprot:GBF96547.1 hypothetical protein Rsub_09130 [Raphidocelis subcapitata]